MKLKNIKKYFLISRFNSKLKEIVKKKIIYFLKKKKFI